MSPRLVAEGIGTALLLAAVVGSGIMGERLAGGNVALALLANTAATGAVLVALIYSLAPISGAHFNPLVTLAAAIEADLPWSDVPRYVAAQLAGGLVGVGVAHLMFDLPLYSFSQHARSGPAQLLSEAVATFGLLVVIGRSVKAHAPVAITVGAYIASAYWFTASTSFANPVVTLARSLSNTFAGIRPVDVPGFVLAQIAGALLAVWLLRWLDESRSAAQISAKDRAHDDTPRALPLHR